MRSFKRVLMPLIMIAVFIIVLFAADFILYPCTFMRNDIHAICVNEYDDVFVGTSHGKMNIDPETMEKVTGRTGHNLCVGGEYPLDVLYMVKLMIERGHAPKRVVYEVSPGYFVREKEVGNNYLLFYHEFPLSFTKLDYFRAALLKCDFRTWFFPWYEYDLSYEISHAKENITKKFSKDYSADSFATGTQKYHESGFIERYPVEVDELKAELLEEDNVEEWFPEDIIETNMDNLESIIKICKENDIEFVAVTTPLSDEVLQIAGDGNSALNDYYKEFFEKAGVKYINFNYGKYYDMADHSLEGYTDLDGHMNGDVARSFSELLAKVLEN